MRLPLLVVLLLVLLPRIGGAQDVPIDPNTGLPYPTPAPFTASTYPLYPPGMRVIVGSGGALARNQPSFTGTCGPDNHACTAADAVAPNTYGVVQSNPPVLDSGGWYWHRVLFETAVEGWVTVTGPERLSALSPPQMIQGSSFQIVGDYLGPILTGARCILDGVNSDAVRSLAPDAAGQKGTLHCPWPKADLGNHIAVIQAINNAGTMNSSEFQFAVTAAPVAPIPAVPSNLRIAPSSGVAIQIAPFDAKTFKPIEQPNLPAAAPQKK